MIFQLLQFVSNRSNLLKEDIIFVILSPDYSRMLLWLKNVNTTSGSNSGSSSSLSLVPEKVSIDPRWMRKMPCRDLFMFFKYIFIMPATVSQRIDHLFTLSVIKKGDWNSCISLCRIDLALWCLIRNKDKRKLRKKNFFGIRTDEGWVAGICVEFLVDNEEWKNFHDWISESMKSVKSAWDAKYWPVGMYIKRKQNPRDGADISIALIYRCKKKNKLGEACAPQTPRLRRLSIPIFYCPRSRLFRIGQFLLTEDPRAILAGSLPAKVYVLYLPLSFCSSRLLPYFYRPKCNWGKIFCPEEDCRKK